MNTKEQIKKALDKGLFVLVEKTGEYKLFMPKESGSVGHNNVYRSTPFCFSKQKALNEVFNTFESLDRIEESTLEWKVIQTYTPQEIFEPSVFEEGEEVYDIVRDEMVEIKCYHEDRKCYTVLVGEDYKHRFATHDWLKYSTEEQNEEGSNMECKKCGKKTDIPKDSFRATFCENCGPALGNEQEQQSKEDEPSFTKGIKLLIEYFDKRAGTMDRLMSKLDDKSDEDIGIIETNDPKADGGATGRDGSKKKNKARISETLLRQSLK